MTPTEEKEMTWTLFRKREGKTNVEFKSVIRRKHENGKYYLIVVYKVFKLIAHAKSEMLGFEEHFKLECKRAKLMHILPRDIDNSDFMGVKCYSLSKFQD